MTKGKKSKRSARKVEGSRLNSLPIARSLASRLKPARLQSTDSGSGSATIVGSEYIASIDTTSIGTTSAGDILFAMYLGFDPDSEVVVAIPGGHTTDLANLSSRVGYLAHAWEKFTFDELSFEYVPFCSALTSGGLILSTDTDPFDLGASSSTATVSSIPLQQLMVRDGAVDTQVFQPTMHKVPLDRTIHYYVEGGDGLASTSVPSQVRLCNAGIFEVCAAGALPTTMLGSIIMHYKIRLMNPTIPAPSASPGPVLGSETGLVVSPLAGGITTIVAPSASNGSYLFTPSGSTPTGQVIKQYDTSDSFVPVPWWNYTSNTFAESGVYEVVGQWATTNNNSGGASNVDKTQLNPNSTYSDTALGVSPTFVPATPTFWEKFGGFASTLISGVGAAATAGNVAGIITAVAGDALAAYINGTRTVASSSPMYLFRDIAKLLIRKIASSSSSLYRALRAQQTRGDYISDWDLRYGTMELGDGTLACNVGRVIVNGDERFDGIEGYQQALRDAVLSDIANLPVVASAVTLYDDFLSFNERSNCSGGSTSGVGAGTHVTYVVQANAKPGYAHGVQPGRS